MPRPHFLIRIVGLELGNPWIWIIALAIGLALGLMIGALQGFIIAYLDVPSFIVTLGGLLVWRGAAWWVTSGQTVAPLDATFQLMGGGPRGSIGATWSWIVGVVACAALCFALLNGRRQRKRFKFPLRPVWAEVFLGIVACADHPWRRLDRQLLSLAGGNREEIRRGQRHHNA